MTHVLFLGDRSYSSWSLRAWLLVARPGIPHETRFVAFDAGPAAAQMSGVAPSRTVPTLLADDGTVVWDSIAIAEELASRHPEAALWPADPAARGTARALAAEMHAGFAPLRIHCPMNLRTAYADCAPTPEVLADVARIETIWAHARDRFGAAGPWLCGAWSAADAFFAPVACRIAGYSLPASEASAAYVAAQLADPAFRRWRAMGLVQGATLARYARDWPVKPWPGPVPRPARAVPAGPSENAACPFSGKPPTHFAEIEGRIWGFCNAFCRDKAVADPDAWPEVRALIG